MIIHTVTEDEKAITRIAKRDSLRDTAMTGAQTKGSQGANILKGSAESDSRREGQGGAHKIVIRSGLLYESTREHVLRRRGKVVILATSCGRRASSTYRYRLAPEGVTRQSQQGSLDIEGTSSGRRAQSHVPAGIAMCTMCQRGSCASRALSKFQERQLSAGLTRNSRNVTCRQDSLEITGRSCAGRTHSKFQERHVPARLT